jgi:hypothetical protein
VTTPAHLSPRPHTSPRLLFFLQRASPLGLLALSQLATVSHQHQLGLQRLGAGRLDSGATIPLPSIAGTGPRRDIEPGGVPAAGLHALATTLHQVWLAGRSCRRWDDGRGERGRAIAAGEKREQSQEERCATEQKRSAHGLVRPDQAGWREARCRPGEWLHPAAPRGVRSCRQASAACRSLAEQAALPTDRTDFQPSGYTRRG